MNGSRRGFLVAAVGVMSGCTARSAADSAENSTNGGGEHDSEDPAAVDQESESVSDNSVEYPRSHEFAVEPLTWGDSVKMEPERAVIRRHMDVYRPGPDAVRRETFDPPLWSVELGVETRKSAVTLPDPDSYALLGADSGPLCTASRESFEGNAGAKRSNLRFETPTIDGFETVPGPDRRLLSANNNSVRYLTFAAPIGEVATLGVEGLGGGSEWGGWPVELGD